jgi:4-hydroxy-4-methyl-2-oxoglutarate aldolase
MERQAMFDELRKLGAATVYEAQGASSAMDGGIKPIDPRSRLVGPAFTVDMRPADNLMLHYALLKAKPGDVLVVDAKGFLEAGPWGDVLTAQAMRMGLAGLLIDGAVRDADAIVAAGFPVFCRGLSIKGTGKHQPGLIGVPVSVGGVVVRPGDIVVGDRDGVAIVAHERLADVVSASVAREQKEGQMRSSIAAGATTAELLNLTATLQRLGLR